MRRFMYPHLFVAEALQTPLSSNYAPLSLGSLRDATAAFPSSIAHSRTPRSADSSKESTVAVREVAPDCQARWQCCQSSSQFGDAHFLHGIGCRQFGGNALQDCMEHFKDGIALRKCCDRLAILISACSGWRSRPAMLADDPARWNGPMTG